MKKCKKVIILLLLMITFLSLIQNIVYGATVINKADLIRGPEINTHVNFDDKEQGAIYKVEANYIYYSHNGQHPAYCITHRSIWSG